MATELRDVGLGTRPRYHSRACLAATLPGEDTRSIGIRYSKLQVLAGDALMSLTFTPASS
jgi:hypothetical protein